MGLIAPLSLRPGGRRPCVSRPRKGVAYADEVVGNHTESDPPPDTVQAAIAAPAQSVAPLQYADSALTAGAPSLPFFEPAGVLDLSSFLAARVPIWNRNLGNAHLMRGLFIRLGVEG